MFWRPATAARQFCARVIYDHLPNQTSFSCQPFRPECFWALDVGLKWLGATVLGVGSSHKAEVGSGKVTVEVRKTGNFKGQRE